MRQPRIKAEPGEDAIYNLGDTMVGGEYLLEGSDEKRAYIDSMNRCAKFFSISILEYNIMDNHTHMIVFAPGKIELADEELLNRLKDYYGEKHRNARQFEKAMQFGGSVLGDLRKNYMDRIGNISEFKKSHKIIFTDWYNRRHKRRGTLCTERFDSALAEDNLQTRLNISGYITLNSVRAKMVEDPKDYTHCGYAAALAGDEQCRKGIMQIMGMDNWEDAAAEYRMFIIQAGYKKRPDKRGSISEELLRKTLKQKGILPRSELMRIRIAHLSKGLVLGSQAFVSKYFDRHRSHFGKKRKQASFPLEGFGEIPLHTMRLVRN
jgi:REP element-mobilizing transposase RayT